MLVCSYFINEDTEVQKETKVLAQSPTVKERKAKTPASVLCFPVQLSSGSTTESDTVSPNHSLWGQTTKVQTQLPPPQLDDLEQMT